LNNDAAYRQGGHAFLSDGYFSKIAANPAHAFLSVAQGLKNRRKLVLRPE
jgi:hypothetical protein